MWRTVQKVFLGETLSHSLLETLIVLIPKCDPPTRLKDFRPISLCNVIYKLVTKVLVNRLRPFLDEIVSPTQGGFIHGRGAPDNIIVAQEVLHFLKRTKSRKGAMAFKIDLEKAYDRVDWNFLEHTLESFGFPSLIIRLVMNCVQASNLSILWNGNRLDSFQPRRGLRQGDPISPYLFVLCMERLACFISKQVDEGIWDGVAVSRGGPRVSHLMFADDLLLFCKAKKSQVQNVVHTLELFCKASGMKINIEKSKAICSRNISNRRKEMLSGVSHIPFTSDLGKYLGVNLNHPRAARSIFSDSLEKIKNRLASWKGRLLNRAGRLCLIKSVASSLPIYQMQVTLFPTSVCQKIDSVLRQFL